MWRIVTFNFTGKGTYEGTFAIEVDNSGVPVQTGGSLNFTSISGDAVEDCNYSGSGALYIANNTLSLGAVLNNFPSAVEGQTYTDGEPTRSWSYVNATTYTIIASAGTGGLISPSGSVSVFEGQDQAFTITPSEGYKIASVLVDGTETKQDLVNNVYTFTNVSSVHTIAASFEELGIYDIIIEMDLTGEYFKFEFQKLIDGIIAAGALDIVSSTNDITTGTGTITITGTDTLPDNVFQSQTHITSVVLPDCFTEIEDAAFAGCSNMVSITLPDTIEVIGADAFSECTSLTSLELPASVTEVGEGFLDACDSLETLTCNSPVPPTTGSTISTLTLPELQVPESSVSAYQNNPVWGSTFTVIKSTTPGPKPVKGYGFNTSGMIDTDYLNEVFIRRN